MRLVLVILILEGVRLKAQAPTSFPPDGPPLIPYETLAFNDVDGNPEYFCIARASAQTTIFARTIAESSPTPPTGSALTLTSIVVSGGTVGTITLSAAHGMDKWQMVTVAGSSTSALNASYIVQSKTGTTLVITTAGVSNGTYNNADLKVTTVAPRTSMPVWSIQRFLWATGIFQRSAWAAVGTSGSTTANAVCDNRATYFP